MRDIYRFVHEHNGHVQVYMVLMVHVCVRVRMGDSVALRLACKSKT